MEPCWNSSKNKDLAMTNLKHLFEPVTIGPLRLKNRIIMPALTTLYEFEGGTRYADFYAERARGGVSMIIINLQALYPGRAGVSGAVPDESASERGPVKINHDAYIPRLKGWTRAIQENGAKVAAQLAVYGFWARGGYGAPAEEVSPSGIRLEGEDFRPSLEKLTVIRGGRPLLADEIKLIQEEVADAAQRAVKAGFDAIELQALGGNLLSRFLSPLTNQRSDAYGGSLENRARMLIETIAAIKRRVGDFPLICRNNGDDLMPGGMGPSDYQELAPLLADAGVHALNLMPGWYETRRPVNQMNVPQGAFVYAAEALKQVVDIPVAANIRINDPVMADRILADKKADIIAMCSALMADPFLPEKARQGRPEDIRKCVACCNCWSDLAGRRIPIGCSVNARMGMEKAYTLVPADRPKTIWVIGGGPGGMEAARIAAKRGHRVVLFDNRDRLGGQLLYADLPPHKGEWKNFVAYLSTQLEKLGVDVRLNKSVRVSDVQAGKPDAVVVATGARSLIPPIPGVDGDNVVTCVEVLTGKKQTGQQVIIIGGGSVGCETAEFLTDRGKTVTIVEMQAEIAPDVDFWNRWVLMDRLTAANISLLTNARADAITPEGIELCADNTSRFVPADTIVLAAGAVAHDSLLKKLQAVFDNIHPVGDCSKPRKVRQAVESGYKIGMEI